MSFHNVVLLFFEILFIIVSSFSISVTIPVTDINIADVSHFVNSFFSIL